jgi:hypothetical protein
MRTDGAFLGQLVQEVGTWSVIALFLSIKADTVGAHNVD